MECQKKAETNLDICWKRIWQSPVNKIMRNMFFFHLLNEFNIYEYVYYTRI